MISIDDQMARMEAAVIDIIALQSGADCFFIRSQYAVAEVIERDYSGAGFFTTYRVPESADRISEKLVAKRAFGRVEARFDDAADLGFILFVTKDGRLDFLEGYAYSAEWRPKNMPPLEVVDVTQMASENSASHGREG